MVKVKCYFERCAAHEPEFLRTMLRKNSPFSVGGCVAMNPQGICPSSIRRCLRDEQPEAFDQGKRVADFVHGRRHGIAMARIARQHCP